MKTFDFRERLVSVNWQKILEDLHHLSTSFNRMLLVVLGRYTKGWSITAFTVAKRVHHLYRKNGARFCSSYLKNASTQLHNYLSYTQEDTPYKPMMYGPRCSTTRRGLPRIILSKHRKIIRECGPDAITTVRCYLTLFGFYRTYIDTKKVANLKAIEQKGGLIKQTGEEKVYDTPNLVKGEHDVTEDIYLWFEQVFPRLAMGTLKSVFPTEVRLGFNWLPSWSGGPNTRNTPLRTSVNVLRFDAGHWLFSLMESFKTTRPEDNTFFKMVGIFYPPRLINLPTAPLIPVSPEKFMNFLAVLSPPKKGRWGTLGLKREGGGKVRVFAMLDSIRQAMLRPLHHWLMSVLQCITNDGTFDQIKPLVKLRNKQLKELFSFDLTSATDRFPMFLQGSILTGFFGHNMALAWQYAMELPFEVPFLKSKPTVTFSVGQPLGAYSSWAAFALTHHAFVQYCAQKAGLSKRRWFDDYAILGDDLIIGSRDVATVYEELIKMFGVSISEHKSIISNNGSCEFAKRFLWQGNNVSPISFKEVYVMRRSTCGQLVDRITTFRDVRRSEPFRWFGASYKVLPNTFKPPKGRWKRFNLMLSCPAGPFPLPFYWWASLYSHRPIGQQESAIVHQELMDKWQFSFEPEGIPTERKSDIVEEVLIGRPWIKSWLDISTDFLLALMEDDPIMAWFYRPSVPNTAAKAVVNRSFRLGKIYWIYDRLVAISKKPPLKRIGI